MSRPVPQNYAVSRDAVPSERPETMLEGISHSLDTLADELFLQVQFLREIADRAFGALPPSPVADQTVAKTGCMMDDVRQNIDRCGWARQAIADQVDRFRSLA